MTKENKPRELTKEEIEMATMMFKANAAADRPLLVCIDQPTSNGGAAVKLVLTALLTIGSVVAGNEITRKIHD
jgi:hypothetical protein